MLQKRINTTTAFQFFQIARYASLTLGSIFITKSGVSQKDIGIYETVLLMAGSLSFFWINGFLTTFLRSYAKAENKSSVLANSIFLITVTIIICFFLFYIFKKQFINFFCTNEEYFPLFIVFFLFNSIGFATEYILLAKEKVKGLILLGIFHLIFQSVFIALPAFTSADIDQVIMGLIAFSTLKFVVFVFVFFDSKPGALDFADIKQQFKTAAPLIISFFLGGVSIYVDGMIVNYYYDKSTFALFQYGAKEFPLSLLLANALSVAMVQKITTNAQSGLSELRSGSLRLMHFLFPISILLIASSKYLYPLIFNEQFSESFIYFNIYL
ncbi:MAG: hypothetical protein H7Y00_07485, partial [Fimbriimonadaceae bacterium]|nr:hypothetical protein [Chitinophagales bacterium]